MSRTCGETEGRAAPLRVATTELIQGVHLLSAEASHYVTRVHRKLPGDELELFDPERGSSALAVVGCLLGRQLQCEVGKVCEGTRFGCFGLHLVQGLSKGDKSERVVRDAVALGAQSISLVQAQRSVVRVTDASDSKHARLVRVAVEAARQSGRSTVPTLHIDPDWSAVHERHQSRFGLVLHPEATTQSVEQVLWARQKAPDAVVVYVGPEGGFDAQEVAALLRQGAFCASLGELVLRTELAAVVALARVSAVLTAMR